MLMLTPGLARVASQPRRVAKVDGEQWSRWLDEVISGNLTNTNGTVTVLVAPAPGSFAAS